MRGLDATQRVVARVVSTQNLVVFLFCLASDAVVET